MRALFLCGFAVFAAMPARADVTGMPPVAIICIVRQPVTVEGVMAALNSDACTSAHLPLRQATAAELSRAPSRQTTLDDLRHPTGEPTWGMPKPPGAP